MMKPYLALAALILSVEMFCSEGVFAQTVPDGEIGVFSTLEGLTFRTKFLEYVVSYNCRNRFFRNIKTGKDYNRISSNPEFMQLKINGVTHIPVELQYENGILIVQFAGTEANVSFLVEVKNRYIAFKLIEVSGSGVEELVIANLALNLNKYIGTLLNVARDDDFGACVMALNVNTYSRGVSSAQALLMASCYTQYGMDNAGVAIIGCPGDSLLPAIEQVQLDNGLPHPTLSGVWNRFSPDVKQSYFFLDWTQDTIDNAIGYARQGGFGYMMLYRWFFSPTDGHYSIREDNFPGGLDGLKETVQKVHDNGMKAGMHFLVNWITKSDPYVTPVPHPQLGKDGFFTLAEDLNATAAFIPVAESTKGVATSTAIRGRGGVTLQIGNELITYTGISASPNGFSGCKRGILNTTASAHVAGDSVFHLAEVWQTFTADPHSALFDTITQRVADIINYCGFDMIYYDGGETMSIFGPEWYALSKIELAFYGKFQREVLIQGSGMTHYLWNTFSRGNSDDWVALGNKSFLDYHKIPNRILGYEKNLIAGELGWYGVLAQTPSYPATTPDEIEYPCSKAIGYDCALSLETHQYELEGNGRTGEILEMMKNYETLRLQGYFSEEIKEQLRELGQEHTLLHTGEGEWKLFPIKYYPYFEIADVDGIHNEWIVKNEYPPQPLKLRMYAKWGLAEFGDANNIVVGDFSSVEQLVRRTSSGNSIMVEEAGAVRGRNVIKLTVQNSLNAVGRWCGVRYALPTRLNLSGNRALGVWVTGDGSGAALCIHLEDASEFGRDYHVPLTFTDRRYFELSEPISDEYWNYISWPYGPKNIMRGINWNTISFVDLYVNGMPPRSIVTCLVSEPEALKEYDTDIVNPTIEIWGKKVVFPITLHEDEYVELDRNGTCRAFDKNGFTTKEIVIDETIPIITNGDNKLVFGADRWSKWGPRAKVSVITMGEALTGEIPALVVPDDFFLAENYPNPFNLLTNIRFALPGSSRVTLKVYNILGQEIKTIINEELPEGEHLASWDGTNALNAEVSSGIYIYRLKADYFVKSKMMTLTK